MDYCDLDVRVNSLNDEIENLKLLNICYYDCDKDGFKKEIKRKVIYLLNELHKIEELIEENSLSSL